MYDFNYMALGCYEIVLDLACCKNQSIYTSNSESNKNLRDSNWVQNRLLLINYLKNANKGVRGLVRYADGEPAVNLTVRIDSREPYFKTNKHGEYYRILLPGDYQLELLIGCDSVYMANITVNETNHGLLQHNVYLLQTKSNFSLLFDFTQMNRFSQFCSNQRDANNCSVNLSLVVREAFDSANHGSFLFIFYAKKQCFSVCLFSLVWFLFELVVI
jgi:hypothetical protein